MGSHLWSASLSLFSFSFFFLSLQQRREGASYVHNSAAGTASKID